ncbi:hypothetical protein K461DRAFT_241163 [Myriangium duriaei CBS 260.36]|uniref:UBA domain-containing protein n=1 Tax=Myriangium duriaei CBS 260.36 TaxID=1168546 RepID=A0A9P4J2K1_9PEZI|nr:hypothetical protein K461DRAFT_241163 [Myriangium duriaei CBS 260.36]
MDDLAGLDWNAKANGAQQSRPPPGAPSYASITPTLRPNFASSTLNPQFSSRPNSALSGTGSIGSPAKAASPANDSFSNLLPTTANKAKTNLSLQDRQNQLLQERQRQIQEQQQRHNSEAQLWEKLGTGSRPSSAQPGAARPSAVNGNKKEEDVDDILAAFSSSAKVDRSSHFPPPMSASHSGRSTPGMLQPPASSNGMTTGGFDDDDDPFGLGSMPARQSQTTKSPSPQPLPIDEDFLGELGKPVQPRKQKSPSPPPAPARDPSPPGDFRAKANSTPLDRSIAELVDMGFPPDKARVALEATDGNLQTAVGWLLNQAHAESQQKAHGRSAERHASPAKPRQTDQANVPSWMRADSRSGSQPRRPESGASNPDRDVSQYASEVGTSFLKSANSLWKAGRKQVQKAVADFQQEGSGGGGGGGGDPSQPKWMRDASSDSHRSATPSQARQHSSHTPANLQSNHRTNQKPVDMTDEAMLLESGDSRPARPSKTSVRTTNEPPAPSPLRGRSPAQVLPERSAPAQRFPQHPAAPQRQPTKLNREQVEEQASQAYVSSARRRKPAVPAAPKESEPEVDLFSPAPPKPQPSPAPVSRPQPSASRPSPVPAPSRPNAPPRSIPPVSPAVLSQSAQHRAKGTEAFKRGDFDAAHQSYTAALTPLPPTHPITIIILSNRALTAIKTGDPKLAIQDADKAIALIGPSRGEAEIVDLGGADGSKDMKDFYGKALMRKAEALEAMEKWTDAGDTWRLAIEAGVGGLVAVRGRDRCAKAANPPPPAAAARSTPKPAARAPPRKVEPARPKLGTSASGDAVKKLREANAKEAAVDDEKFALADAVSARVEGWRGGKSDNLRALLGSLETVLWEGAGWKKVGMAELVLPNRVKVVYMKAIARVHPDKIPQDATTEQRMISGSVFSTLNEAWDKFKTENGL